MTYDELKNLVKHHCDLYYNKHAPEISDAAFDKLYDDLVEVEHKQGWTAYDSPTTKVGGAGGKIAHPIKLYSLKKVYNIEEVDPAFTVETPKIDGANLTLIYKYGKLSLALTRGNGETGDNVTHLAKEISNIPKSFNTELALIIVNGECVTDNNVENYRNYVSGALGLKDCNEFRTRNIKFIAHDYLNIEINYLLRMSLLTNMGFTTVLDEKAKSYPTDGKVFRLNSYRESQNLGYTSKYPRFAVALKTRELVTAKTTLLRVDWAVGRTGTVNPTAVIEPVIIDDAEISRLTLHNLGFIEENKLGLGDIIEIERAGGVIPKFLRVITQSSHARLSIRDAESAINAEVYREGPKLFVKDATAATDKSLEHFIKTIEIKGLGPAAISKMKLTHPLDIYSITDWSALGANGVKVAEEVEKSKNKPYPVVLAALGIPSVGKATAELIASRLTSFKQLKDISHTEIKGIGPATKEAILDWLATNESWVWELPLRLEQQTQVTSILNTSKKVCITGKLDMDRSDLVDILNKFGFVESKTVTKDCYALIYAGDTTSSKYKKAVAQGTTLVDYWANRKNILQGNF